MRGSKKEREEGEIIEKYYDLRMEEALEPLYQRFQEWKKGEISHDELSDAVHKCHERIQKIHSLFGSDREFLMKLIEADDVIPYDRNCNMTD